MSIHGVPNIFQIFSKIRINQLLALRFCQWVDFTTYISMQDFAQLLFKPANPHMDEPAFPRVLPKKYDRKFFRGILEGTTDLRDVREPGSFSNDTQANIWRNLQVQQVFHC